MKNLEKTRRIGEEYRKAFHGMKGIRLQESAPDSEPCYWLNCILIDRPEEEVREIGNELIRRGVEIRPAFWPLGDLPAFSRYAYGPQEKAMQLFRQMIVLPSAAKLADDGCKGVHDVVNIVREVMGGKKPQ